MINMRGMQRVCILGAGTAGWFMALELKRILNPSVEIMVISAPDIPIVGVGEGGVLNLLSTLRRLEISWLDFIEASGATVKLGFRYERWRTGREDDFFYHMFPVKSKELDWQEFGCYPYLSLLINHGIDVSSYMDSIALTERNASQQEVVHSLINEKNNFGASMHFDTYRLGLFLRKIALDRGVRHHVGFVKDIMLNGETGLAQAVEFEGECVACNFLVDASGFSRAVIQKKLRSDWRSFKDYLVMDTAIPFHLVHSKPNPELVTRATAMDAGWVWQIPLQERIGAGYVFDSQFITPDQAVRELESWLGYCVEPIRTIKFDAGYYKQVWQGNILSIGLASGFVEPLEATSIGQMLAQVEVFSSLIVESHGVIPQSTINYFNQQNTQMWEGIGDFIRMHYDTGRSDTAFWQHNNNLPYTDKYRELKSVWKERTPRDVDFLNYSLDGVSMFNSLNWTAVGVGVGVIQAEATAAELMVLAPEQHRLLANYLHETKRRLGL